VRRDLIPALKGSYSPNKQNFELYAPVFVLLRVSATDIEHHQGEKYKYGRKVYTEESFSHKYVVENKNGCTNFVLCLCGLY
jgi:hypothetical protein